MDSFAVYRRDGWKCAYCGRFMPPHPCSGTHGAISVDHKQPRSRGGTDDLDNLVTACKHCNTQKRDKTAEEYANYLLTHPPSGAAHLNDGDPDDPTGERAADWRRASANW